MSNFKTGRLPRDPNIPVPQLTPYLARGSASGYTHVPPSAVDYYSRISEWGMMLNDQLGDCTCAADGHICLQQNFYGRGFTPVIPDQEIERAYEKVGGYIPGNPATDRGAMITDALDYLIHTGIGGWQITAYGEIDVRGTEELRRAIWEFGAVSIGVLLPPSAQDQFGANQPWTVVPGEQGEDGHCVVLVGYDTDHLYCISWGRVQPMSWEWFQAYCDEAHAIISKTWDSVSGLNLESFGAEFAQIFQVANPFAPPAPPAPPGPIHHTKPKVSLWQRILNFFFGGHLA